MKWGFSKRVKAMISIVSQEGWEGKEEESEVNFVEVLSVLLRKWPGGRRSGC